MSWGWLPWTMVFTWSHYLRIIEKVPKHQFVTLTIQQRVGIERVAATKLLPTAAATRQARHVAGGG